MNNKNFSNDKITFLIDIDKSLHIDKTAKYKYYKMYGLNKIHIDNFISNIRSNDTFLIHPFVSINCFIDEPMLNLSRQFLVSYLSNPKLIHDYLFAKIDQAADEFDFLS